MYCATLYLFFIEMMPGQIGWKSIEIMPGQIRIVWKSIEMMPGRIGLIGLQLPGRMVEFDRHLKPLTGRHTM